MITKKNVSVLQENQRTSLKAMGEAMSTMQDKMVQDHSRVQSLWSNLTDNHTDRSERPLTETQHSDQLPALVARLTHIVDEYDALVVDLPHGKCSRSNN